MRRMTWSAALVGSAAVAVLAVVVVLLAGWPPPPPPQADGAKREGGGSRSGGDDRVVLAVLGDSFSAENPTTRGPEWPRTLARRLGWALADSSVNGSGYLSPGATRSFGARVPSVVAQRPDVVLVAGGAEDVGAYPMSEVSAAAEDVVRRLSAGTGDTEVVLVSPFSRGEPGPLTLQLNEAFRRVAERTETAYVDATRWLVPATGLFTPDGMHPDATGHAVLARRMERELRRQGVVAAVEQRAG